MTAIVILGIVAGVVMLAILAGASMGSVRARSAYTGFALVLVIGVGLAFFLDEWSNREVRDAGRALQVKLHDAGMKNTKVMIAGPNLSVQGDVGSEAEQEQVQEIAATLQETFWHGKIGVSVKVAKHAHADKKENEAKPNPDLIGVWEFRVATGNGQLEFRKDGTVVMLDDKGKYRWLKNDVIEIEWADKEMGKIQYQVEFSEDKKTMTLTDPDKKQEKYFRPG